MSCYAPATVSSYRPVDAFEYEEIWEGVQAGTYEYDVVDEEFDLNSLTPVSSSR